ncbi:hypothetical protein M3226_31065, partial [Neobacillus cucumis]|uniref:hypothetical protein n=1 Tax=Neobacillus cucumis TaxID=1740721 RepID=UPI00203E0478
ALTHHSSSTFLSSRRISIDGLKPFSFSVVKSWFLAIHGWLTGRLIQQLFCHHSIKRMTGSSFFIKA